MRNDTPGGGDPLLKALRAVCAVHILAVFSQAVSAGQFLSGDPTPVRFHEVGAWVILTVAAAQLILVIIRGRFFTGMLPLTLSSVAILLCEGLQTGTGYGRFPQVHIPLAVLIFGGLVWQGYQLFRSPNPGRQPI